MVTVMDINNMRQRRICAKSRYKMTCGCCGKTIHRGDEITQVLGSRGRMRARTCTAHVSYGDEDFMQAAAANAKSGIKTPYSYAPTRNRWVHLTCRPQYFKDWGNGSVGFFPHPTAYSRDLDQRRTAASFDPDWGEDLSDIPYPEWKWETERIEAIIIPLQRMWKKKFAKIVQNKWKKHLLEAYAVLETARQDVRYKWQEDKLYQIWGYLGFGGLKKQNKSWFQMSVKHGPCTEEYRTSWTKNITAAARTIDYAHCDWRFSWQYVILEALRKKCAK